MGDRRAWVVVAVLMLAFTACNDANTDPTLAPGTTAPVTTASTTTTEPTTTSTEAPTTTVGVTTTDPDARRAEIEALAKDTYVGRLDAIYREDKVALTDFLGSQAGYDDAVAAIDEQRIGFLEAPTEANLVLTVDEVLLDREDCVVADVTIEATGVVEGATQPGSLIYVYWPSSSGVFLQGAVWESGTPQFQWIEECDIAIRGVEA